MTFINGTLVVQLIHIACAYVLLDKFLLKYAVAVIQEDEHKEKTIRASLEREQALVREKEMAKAKAWNHMRRRFLESAPSLDVSGTPQRSISLESSIEPSPHDVEQYVREVAQAIKAKVDHGS